MTEFKLMEDDDFRNIKIHKIIEKNEKHMESDYKICTDCNVSMNFNINNSYTCPKCGFIKKISTGNLEYEESFKNYNVSNKSHMPIKYIGKNSYKLQQNLRNSTSQYDPIQESYIRKILNTCNSESTDFRIPQNIIKDTIDLYKKIRKHSKVFRGDILKGVLGSLLHYLCKREGIIRKPKEIAKWCSISDKDLSTGDKHVRQLENDGVLLNLIVDNDEENLDKIHILSYLFRLKIQEKIINDKYLPFLLNLLNEINEKKIGKVNSRTSTKITGIVYLLCITEKLILDESIKSNISTEQCISNEFKISISTFKEFYNEILKKKEKVIAVFDKYNITFPDKSANRKNRKIKT